MQVLCLPSGSTMLASWQVPFDKITTPLQAEAPAQLQASLPGCRSTARLREKLGEWLGFAAMNMPTLLHNFLTDAFWIPCKFEEERVHLFRQGGARARPFSVAFLLFRAVLCTEIGRAHV